jgi:tRNA A-37 threonylcarbamoyl transferase component Bud32
MAAELAQPRVRLQMAPELREHLVGSHGLPLADWLRDGIATIVKQAPHRAVYRVCLPGLDCHVKQYRPVGFRSRVREMLRPNKARREYEMAAGLYARGVPTPQPLAWGVEESGFAPAPSWLITMTVPDAVPLLTYVESAVPQLNGRSRVLVRQGLARTIGALLAQMHGAGIVHHDLHPGNILVRVEPDGRPRLWLIDLHAVTLQPACPWQVRQANLVIFNRYFQLRATRADRLRFWRAYSALAGNVVPEPRRMLVCQLERQTQISNGQFWRARDARCLKSNRYYQRIAQGDYRGYAVRDLDSSLLEQLASDPNGPFESPESKILKTSRSSTVVECLLDGPEPRRPVIYKRFQVTDRRDGWLGLVRMTSAIRSWVFGHGLRERRLPTARPLAIVHRYSGGLPREGYLLTEKIENAVDLHEFVRRLAILPTATAKGILRRRLEKLARLIRILHERGLTHRDLKASNILTAAPIDDHRFWFIDLVGVRRRGYVGRQRKMRDLMRLYASFRCHALITRTERLRFLRAYLRVGIHGVDGWKDRWRAVDAATIIKVAKNALSGRPLA